MMLAFDSRADTAHEFVAEVHGADLTARAQLVPDELDCDSGTSCAPTQRGPAGRCCSISR
jgi:hypothetical protein